MPPSFYGTQVFLIRFIDDALMCIGQYERQVVPSLQQAVYAWEDLHAVRPFFVLMPAQYGCLIGRFRYLELIERVVVGFLVSLPHVDDDVGIVDGDGSKGSFSRDCD